MGRMEERGGRRGEEESGGRRGEERVERRERDAVAREEDEEGSCCK